MQLFTWPRGFRNFFIDHIPRQQNVHADALASLAASLALPARVVEKILVYSHDLYCPRFAYEDHQKPTGDCQVKEALETSTGPELKDWRFSYIDYALYDILPENPKEAAVIRRKAPKFYYNAITRTLYRRSQDGILLRCLSQKEAQEVLIETHDGICGAHQPGPKLGDRLRDWGITGPSDPRHHRLPNDVTLVKSMVTLSIKHQDIFALQLQPGHLRCEKWTWLALLAHLHPKDIGSS